MLRFVWKQFVFLSQFNLIDGRDSNNVEYNKFNFLGFCYFLIIWFEFEEIFI